MFEVWSEGFAHKLAVRPASQHKVCSLCVRHKAILRKLADDRLGRQAQMKEYTSHLDKQYLDRCIYWSNRTQSRLRAPVPSGHRVLSLIVDGLDHSKMKWPRTAYLVSKEMDKFQRPNCDLTCSLVHGYGAFFFMSLPFVAKDSNLSADVVLHCLHKVSETEALKGSDFDLRSTEVCIQSDNTVREVKNMTSLRLYGLLVGAHKVKQITYSCLMSGHSHEDVDQAFSVVSSWLSQHSELHHPGDFKACLQALLNKPTFRPNEPGRHVEQVGCTRQWMLCCVRLPFHLEFSLFIQC